MKRIKIELNSDELVLIAAGLGHFFDYLDKQKYKEKSIARKKEHEKAQAKINKLANTIADARYKLG